MRCIKDLYKSTYLSLAFERGKEYKVVAEEHLIIWLRDEKENAFAFSKGQSATMYLVGDYFALTEQKRNSDGE